MAEKALTRMTVEEFLAWEDRQEPKYEFVDGRPVMMTGGTIDHGELRGSAYVHFRQALRGRPCRVHLDIKVVCRNGNVRYPDVQIDCGASHGKDITASTPVVVLEVVSPSSRATDYVAKVRDYGTVPSIATYLIVSQDDVHVTVLRRQGETLDLDRVLEDRADVVDLPEAGIRIALSDIYGPEPLPSDPGLSADGG
jgi:Uma2 family endonuclease